MSKIKVEVFYSQGCSNCPPQKKLAKQFESDEVKVKLTDVALNSGRARNHGVRATPTTVIKGPGIRDKMGFKGVMGEEKLEDAIKVAKGELGIDQFKEDSLFESNILGKIKDML